MTATLATVMWEMPATRANTCLQLSRKACAYTRRLANLPTYTAWHQRVHMESQPTEDTHLRYLNSRNNKNVNTHKTPLCQPWQCQFCSGPGSKVHPLLSTTNTTTCGKSLLTFSLCWHLTCLTSSSCPSWHDSVYSAVPHQHSLSCLVHFLFIVSALGDLLRIYCFISLGILNFLHPNKVVFGV